MISKDYDIKKVNDLSPGESCTVFWFDGGGGMVDKLVDLAYTWT